MQIVTMKRILKLCRGLLMGRSNLVLKIKLKHWLMIVAIAFLVMQVWQNSKIPLLEIGLWTRCEIHESWKEQVSTSIKDSETLPFQNSYSIEILGSANKFVWGKHVVMPIKNNKSAGSDGIVGELIKYGGRPVCEMLLALFNLVWDNKYAFTDWSEGLIISLFKKGHRDITLSNVLGKLYNRIITNRLLKYVELKHKLHEGQRVLD